VRYAPAVIQPVEHEAEFVEIVRAPDGALIKELSLVLNSVGIPHQVLGNQHQRWIVVHASRAREALEELSSYHHENVGRRRGRAERLVLHRGVVTHALLWAVVLAFVHLLAHDAALGFDWRAIGRVDGVAIRHGELWRAITALSLHADLNHLVSNLFLGALFVALLAQVIGPASAWLVVLLSGGAGNLFNSLFRPELLSLGASTAVFATLGALTAVQFRRKLQTASARATRWIPLIAGVLLLGWNGMGTTRMDPVEGIVRDANDTTDIGAHVAGFLCGCLFGALAWSFERRWKDLPFERLVLPWLPPVLFAACWGLALTFR